MISFSIARSGIAASMTMTDVSASNVANVDSVGASSSTAYQARDTRLFETAGGGVAAIVVVRSPAETPRYDPSSNSADRSGMVVAPDVDLADERVNQIDAQLTYQANVSVLRTASQMERTAFCMLA